jgi:hypothetical protein
VVTYNLFFHPLRHFPGPLLYRATRISQHVTGMGGRLPQRVLDWHERYGPIVRIAPDELSFASPRAWQDIYGRRRDLPTKELPKSWQRYRQWKEAPQSILSADYDYHAQLRRGIAPGFSEKAMREQEGLIGRYVDKLVDGLRKGRGAEGEQGLQNMRDWYNWTTFDIIGDLTYGESFGCLETSENHSWMKFFADRLRINYFISSLRCLGWTNLSLALTWLLVTVRGDMRTFISGKMAFEARINGPPRPDLMDNLIRTMDEEVFCARSQ